MGFLSLMPAIAEITEFVKRAARDVGFDLAGIAPVRDFGELAYFPEWIAAGHAGEMKYLEARDDEGRLKRESLRVAAPWARSVVVCAINYNTAQPYSTEGSDPERGWISRYAWGAEDYHDAVLRRLREVERRLTAAVGERDRDCGSAERGGPTASLDDDGNLGSTSRSRRTGTPPSTGSGQANATVGGILRLRSGQAPALQSSLRTWCYVDTGPVVERVYAKYAGVGWMGKNTCVLNQKLGSWLFLGVILTSLDLTPDLPAPDRCGTCTRCLDACPTNAFLGPYQLDATKCISYLTIEKRGAIPEELREGMGRHVFGCDICQDVCPWNRKAPVSTTPEFQPRGGLVNPALEWLAEMKAEEFREKFRGSPVRRTKLSGLRRNVVIAMGNSEDRKFVSNLERLLKDEDPVVVESAGWALRRISRRCKPLKGDQ
jgi:epoxyqueuosine reductase